MDFISACRKAISIDSTPAHGNLEIAEYYAELCRAAGLEVQLIPASYRGVSQANLIAWSPGHKDVELLLESHLDTVDPGSYSLWTETDRSPFNATLRDGRIYGLGSADVKLDFLCKLSAIEKIDFSKIKKGFALVGTYGEEIGLEGARQLIKNKIIRARYALIGEPSELGIVYASNGRVVIDFAIPFTAEEIGLRKEHNERESTSSHSRIFSGKAAHSSTPHLGENAIIKMVRYLDDLPEGVLVLSMDGGTAHNVIPGQATLEVDLNDVVRSGIRSKLIRLVTEIENIALDFLRYPAEGFQPATPTYNIGVIRTREDAVEMTLSMRITPSVKEEVLQGWRQRLRKCCDEWDIKMIVRRIIPPAHTNPESSFAQAALEEMRHTHDESKLITKSASNEASIFSAQGTECLVVGPGRSLGNSHTPNEYNELAQMEKSVEFYRRMIARFCL